jgi:hypothetical protein
VDGVVEEEEEEEAVVEVGEGEKPQLLRDVAACVSLTRDGIGMPDD